MNNLSIYDELDQAIDRILASPEAAPRASQTEISELIELAGELRDLPRPNFKTRLRLELEWEAAGRTVTADASQTHLSRPATGTLPSLFGKSWSGYPVRRGNFALSVALHALMMLALGAGLVRVKSTQPHPDRPTYISSRLEPYRPPLGKPESHGGGSGGAADKVPASKGAAPRATREQLAPPIILQNNPAPKLAAIPTVIAPPELKMPGTKQIGDPLSDLARSSNGPGVSGGMGGNYGGGVGGEYGPGRGAGSGGGCCGGVYTIGNGVSMPRPIYSPEPEFSEEARRTKHQGEVTLLATIGADGIPRNLAVVRSLGMGLDEKALETVRTWRFEPAKKDGHPVTVQMNIIVNFRLY